MSKRRRRSSSSQASKAVQTGLGIFSRASPQQRLFLVASIVVIGLIAAAAYFFLLPPVTDPTTPASDESRAAEAGRSTEAPVPDVTASGLGSGGSAQTDWYELRFTNPKYPDNKANHTGGLDTYLVSLINRATRTLDVAAYDFDLQNVAEAIAAAKSRGVLVRMITDSDTVANKKDAEIQTALAKIRNAGIVIVEDNRGPIMHHKFTVVDREWIQTGSWNYTTGDTYRLNNHMIIIRNRELANNYTVEFEKMFVKKQFGPTKDKGVPNPVLTIGGARVQNYFAPEDGVANKLVDTIKTARQSVYFMAFSFTSDPIAAAMLEKAQAGLKVGGVFETTGSNTQFSEFNKMKAAGLEVYTDGNPYVMHHKVIIIDERTVVLGSFNFSDNADKSNDENTLIIDDPNLARAFKQEYDRIAELAKNPPVRKR